MKFSRRPVSGIAPVVLMLGLCYCMSFFHRVSAPVISRDLMDAFSLDAAGYGLLCTATILGYGLTQIPSGIFADVFGGRRTVACYQLFAGLFCLLFSFCEGAGSALAFRFLLGLSLAGNIPAMRILASAVPANRYALSLSILIAFGPVASFLAAYPLAMLSSLAGWRAALSCAGVASLLLCAAVALLLPDSDLAEARRAAGDVSVRAKLAAMRDGMARVAGMRNFWLVFIYFMCMVGNMFTLVGTWWGAFLMQGCGLSKADAGLSLSLVAFVPLAGNLLVSWSSDCVFHSRKLPLVLLAGVHTAVLAWVCLGHPSSVSFPVLTAAGMLLFVSCQTVATICHTILKESVPRAVLGSAGGILNTSGPVCAAAIQVLVGWIVSWRTGAGASGEQAYAMAFSVMLASAFIALAASLFIQDTLRKKA